MNVELAIDAIQALAEYYDKKLSQTQIVMYAEDLSQLEDYELEHAVRTYRQDPRNVFFPLPAKLIQIARPSATDVESRAVEAVSRIIESVARFGWNHPEEAREYIGSLGWRVVKREGGWLRVCETLNEDNVGMFRAQWKTMAIVQSNRASADDDDAPDLVPVFGTKSIDVQGLLPKMP